MESILATDEPAAVEVREADGAFVIVCEHASNRIPKSLGSLGLDAAALRRHIAWDPGAVEVARGLADRLKSALVTQPYSRLVIDCNRDPALADAVTDFSEDTPIPGNAGLSSEEKSSRIGEVWSPFHAALGSLLDRRASSGLNSILVTVHSFTPVYRGVARPWHVGIISTEDRSLSDAMLERLRQDAALTVGDNEPYSAKDNVDYTIRRHGLDRGLPHVMIEIRNDLLASAGDREAWADRLAGILSLLEPAVLADRVV